MPHFKVIPNAGATTRRLLDETLESLETLGYGRGPVQEGGDWHTLLSESRSGGLFCERLVTVVEGAELLGPYPEELVHLIEDEGADGVIILVYGGDARKFFSTRCREKIFFIEGEKVPFWPSQRKTWLRKFASGKGIRLGEPAAALLVDMLEDPEELRSRVESLGAYTSGKEVTEEMVKRLAFDEGHGKMLQFLDAFCGAQIGEMMRSFEYLRKEPSPLPLITALYNRIRPAVYLSFGSKEAVKKVWALLKVRNYAGRMASEASRRYPANSLMKLASELAALSLREKTSAGEGWQGVETALFRCAGLSEDKKKPERPEVSGSFSYQSISKTTRPIPS